MRNESPDPIDTLIDEAARQLVAGEPSSALRSSVRGRIGAHRSVWSFVPALAGAAALLVVAVIVGRGPVGRTLSGPAGSPDERDSVRPTDHPATPKSVPEVASQPNELAAIQPARISARQFTRRLATAIPPPPDEEESPIPFIAIEPLGTVPLRAVPLEAVQIAVDVSSGVMPIEIAPLQIEPLQGQ